MIVSRLIAQNLWSMPDMRPGFSLNTFSSNPKMLYGYLKQFSRSPSLPQHVHYGSVSTSDAHTKAELFNSFFNSVFTPG
uniref:Uncharacterized protein n=1 Tax=Amphimedon queenslandica TaxID=400682 RepID=A0A1X7UA16_AMPQE